MSAFVHGSYVSISIWNKKTWDKSVEHIYDMMLAVKQINGQGLVLHLPKKEPKIILDVFDKCYIVQKYLRRLQIQKLAIFQSKLSSHLSVSKYQL